MVNSVGE